MKQFEGLQHTKKSPSKKYKPAREHKYRKPISHDETGRPSNAYQEYKSFLHWEKHG